MSPPWESNPWTFPHQWGAPITTELQKDSPLTTYRNTDIVVKIMLLITVTQR